MTATIVKPTEPSKDTNSKKYDFNFCHDVSLLNCLTKTQTAGKPKRSNNQLSATTLNQNEQVHAIKAISNSCQIPASTKPITLLLEKR
ncbi:hypothetical protein D9M68_787660 [compost metagenome]